MVWVLGNGQDWLRAGCRGWGRDDGRTVSLVCLCHTALRLPGQFLTVWHHHTRRGSEKELGPRGHCPLFY